MPDSPLQEILCCIGHPVAGNPTQFMMERAFAAAGLDWRYLTLEVPADSLEDAMRGVRALGFKGANFTTPHKVRVIDFLDTLSDEARLMGAVNCMNRVDDQLVGENTDGKGFLQSLCTLTDPTDKRAVVLGAGGAARAIAVEMSLAGVASLTVVNRTPERGQALADLLQQQTQAQIEFVHWQGNYYMPAETDILINATSIGLGDDEARVPIMIETLKPSTIVADVVVARPPTRFLRDAAARGCQTLDGLGMLLNQAVIAFRIWTGIEPDAAVMREALEEYLEI